MVTINLSERSSIGIHLKVHDDKRIKIIFVKEKKHNGNKKQCVPRKAEKIF